jgi:hypothetical protein
MVDGPPSVPPTVAKGRPASVSMGEKQPVVLNCFAGCSYDAILRALGLDPKDVNPEREQTPHRRQTSDSKRPITLKELAQDKALPTKFLTSLGLHDLPNGGVGIPYRDETGATRAVKRRTALAAREGSYWPAGKPLMPYGLEELAYAREEGYLVIPEGESDRWTLRHHQYPVLAIPGASAVGCLKGEHVRGIPKVYLIREPDRAGEHFIPAMAEHLRKIGWNGEAHVISMNGAKDPNELHKRNPDRFKEVFQATLAQAQPLPVEEHATMGDDQERPPPAWPVLDEKALHGLARDLVRTIGPHTESDPVAILIQTFIEFGNVIGRQPHCVVEADVHALNEDAVLVGPTSKARKGTSAGHVRRLFKRVEPLWAEQRMQEGLSSGEGLIWAVRDPIIKREVIREKGRPTGKYQDVEVDQGVRDKRLLIVEAEFASTLRVLGREGNTLSAIIRRAWDSGDLKVLTKNSPAQATGAHISIIGHITRDELLRYLDSTESGNGFGNRFLWCCVRRSKVLPEGGQLNDADLNDLVIRLRKAIDAANQVHEIRRDEEARAIWRKVYPELSDGKPGLLGAMTSRAEAHVMRLSALYALLDCSSVVKADHLRAALALWQYCEASARFIFGDALGDPLADEILQALRTKPEGMTRTDISNHFGRNKNAAQMMRALKLLAEQGLARWEKQDTEGRSAEVWKST